MSAKKIFAKKSKQNYTADLQSQTQTTSVITNPILNNTATTESIPPTEGTKIALSTRPTLKPRIRIPVQVPPKTIRSNSAIHNDSNTSEKFASPDKSSGATSRRFRSQKTATKHFPTFKRTQRQIPMFIPFTEQFNHVQNNPTITKKNKCL